MSSFFFIAKLFINAYLQIIFIGVKSLGQKMLKRLIAK